MSLSSLSEKKTQDPPAPSAGSPDPLKTWGTIFMGPGPMGETTLEGVSGAQNSGWDAATEALYLERVRAKATTLAQDILERARAEADSLRAQARAQGHEEGLTQARQELDEFRANMGDSASAVLRAIEAQSGSVLADWKDDLVAILRLAVTRITGLTLADDRAAVLQTLYLDAVKRFDDHRRLTIYVNPEDEAAVADIILAAKERVPGLEAWSVKPDPDLAPGGLRIESASSLADNSLAAREKAVNDILDGLEIP